MSLKFICLALCSLALLSQAHAQGYAGSNYRPRIVESYPGIIVDKRMVQYNSYAGDNEGVGTVAGAVTGGVVGSAFGGGSGKVATVIGGSVIGGLLGNSIGRSSTRYRRNYMLEYTIRGGDGNLMTIMQTPDVNYPLGQRVLLEYSSDGRWFFVPQY